MNQNYRNDAIPSKSAALFYGAYFAALGVVLPFLGPFLENRGVTAVGIGSALYQEGDAVFGRIQSEMRTIMADEGWETLDELRGCAHDA